ncbi:MAG TPA: LysM peptidoglycan-binding domain-containing protein [Gemmatimonadales bacterium]|nr:LysM peptidoglycan-binding domain-containing protein [Gemmatimonadales bacterium]
MTISRSDVMSALLLLCTAALPAAVSAQTPANPSADSHTVRKGDTLWDLARTYYGDPLLWPQIYRLNTSVVEDPHWIYPGEVLNLRGGDQASAVPGAAAPAAAAAAAQPAADTTAAAAAAAPTDTAAPAAEVAAAPEADAADTANQAADEYLDQPMADDTTGQLFPSANAHTTTPYTADVANQYKPLRRTEFYSAGYLTEGQKLPFGKLKGGVTPKDVDVAPNGRGAVQIHNEVGVTPPQGGSYQVGDTLMIVYVGREVAKYGNVIFPTGMAVVRDVSRPENTAEVIAQYNQLYRGMSMLPAEKFPGSGNSRAVPISDGVQATVITRVFQNRLNLIQDVLLLDKGRTDGVALGDIFEIRRKVVQHPDAADTTPELICRVQIVHLRDHTASGKIVWLGAGTVPDGSPARQVAKLPS